MNFHWAVEVKGTQSLDSNRGRNHDFFFCVYCSVSFMLQSLLRVVLECVLGI